MRGSLIPVEDMRNWAWEKARASSLHLEISFSRSRSYERGFRKGVLYDVYSGQEDSVSLRLLNSSGRQGLSQASPFIANWRETLERLFERAASVLAHSPQDFLRVPPHFLDLRGVPGKEEELRLWNEGFAAPEAMKEPEGMLKRLQSQVRRGKCETLRSDFSIHLEEDFLLSGRGLCLSEKSTLAQAGLTVMARKGASVQTYSCGMSGRFFPDFEKRMPGLAAKASARARRMLAAKAPSGGRKPVVVDPDVGRQIMELLSGTFCADAVQKGESPWAGRRGECVAGAQVSLRDNARLPGGIASTLWDDEGLATAPRVLVEKGVLLGFLYDTYTSRVDGTRSTGNAGRSGSGAVGPCSWNFYLEAGKAAPEDLLRGVKEGIYLTELMGLHTVDMATGDFSLGGAGFLIQKGRLADAVNCFTVAGNIYEMFKRVDGVANDLMFDDSAACPTFRVEFLDIGGA